MFETSLVPPAQCPGPHRVRRRRLRIATAAVLALGFMAGCRAAEPASTGRNSTPDRSSVRFEVLAPDVYQSCGIAAAREAVWVLGCSGKAVKVPTGNGGTRITRAIEGESVGIDSMTGDGSTRLWVISANGSGRLRRGFVASLGATSGDAGTAIDLGSSIPLHGAFVRGTLWVATVEGGLFVVEGSSTRRVSTEPPIVWIVTDADRAWTVAENGAVVERAADGKPTRTFAGVLANASAAGAGLGSVWLAAESGLVRLDAATGTATRVDVSGTVNHIETCGGEVWLSQPDFGLRSIDAGGKVVRTVALNVAPSYLLCDAGRLWILSQDGKLGSIATG
jgi:hypothetical protein